MKISIDQSAKYKDIEIEIRCPAIDEKVQRLISLLKTNSSFIVAKSNGVSYQVQIENIYYIESIDDKTFIYAKNQIYETTTRLYELEEKLAGTNFIRISKFCILNIDMLKNVKALLNGKYEANLLNEETVIISRHYVSSFKNKFGI